MVWVLILFSMVGDAREPVRVAEFETEQACEAARDVIINREGWRELQTGPPKGFCIQALPAPR